MIPTGVGANSLVRPRLPSSGEVVSTVLGLLQQTSLGNAASAYQQQMRMRMRMRMRMVPRPSDVKVWSPRSVAGQPAALRKECSKVTENWHSR